MSEKNDNKRPVSSIFSVFIGIILAILVIAGLISILEKVDRYLSTRIKNYAALKTFAGLLFEIVVHLLLLVFVGYYMYFLLGG
ncbi:MAG: hypothetical protein KJS92_07770 [Bacteroidetes bacterium]|nr:hypothetical protein [Bacteroidota bacterium]